MMGQQWHQLNHMQVICTSLQNITTPPPHHSDFLRAKALPGTQPTTPKHRKPAQDNKVRCTTQHNHPKFPQNYQRDALLMRYLLQPGVRLSVMCWSAMETSEWIELVLGPESTVVLSYTLILHSGPANFPCPAIDCS